MIRSRKSPGPTEVHSDNGYIPYKDYTVYQFFPCSPDQIKILQELEQDFNRKEVNAIFLQKSWAEESSAGEKPDSGPGETAIADKTFRTGRVEVDKPTDVLVKPCVKKEFLTYAHRRQLEPHFAGVVCCADPDGKCHLSANTAMGLFVLSNLVLSYAIYKKCVK